MIHNSLLEVTTNAFTNMIAGNNTTIKVIASNNTTKGDEISWNFNGTDLFTSFVDKV